MRIAFDAHMVGSRETGNEVYARNIASAMARAGKNHEMVIFVTRPSALTEARALPNCSLVAVPSSPFLRLGLAIPYQVWHRKADLLHVTYVAPPILGKPFVVTVHDVSFERFPEFFGLRDLAVLKSLVPMTVRRAHRVIAVSHFTKQEIIDVYRIPESKVVVIHEAADATLGPYPQASEIDRVRAKYGIHGEYILYVGNIQKRKNIARLLRAFSAVQARSDLPLQLVVAGQETGRAEHLGEIERNLCRQGQVRFLGFVPQEDMAPLYSGALVFAYPSLYEGFGLPVVEAMACGTPVLTSNSSALAEVAGDSAMLVDPLSVEDIARGLLTIVTDADLRHRLSNAGRENVCRFSWETSARKTLEVYEQVMSESHHPKVRNR